MVNKILISVFAASEVLTLFPLLFFGIYSMMSSGDITEKSTTSMLVTMVIGILYASCVLLGAYKAVKNISRPRAAYLFLTLPLIIIGIGWILRSYNLI
jgi:hypothetical protein